MTGIGNMEQNRLAAEAIAEAVISKFVSQHPEVIKPELPPPLKWASAILAALFVTGISGMGIWLISTVNEMQVTLARMDERLANQTTSQDGRFDELERRIGMLENDRRSK